MNDLFGGHAAGEIFENVVHGDARSYEAQFSAAYARGHFDDARQIHPMIVLSVDRNELWLAPGTTPVGWTVDSGALRRYG